LFWDVEVTPEDEEDMIQKVAEQIHKYGMDVAAILMLESVKPLAYIGGQMGRFFLSPFLPAFGESIGRGGEKFFTIFEKRENVEKLITLLEKMAKEEEKPKETEKPKEEQATTTEKPTPKKGWRRFIPF
jgi:hypothetical protein